MTVRIGQYEIDLSISKIRPKVGGNLDVRAELESAYAQIKRPRRSPRRKAA